MENLDNILAVIGVLICGYVWVVRPILAAMGINLREPGFLSRLRKRTADAMGVEAPRASGEGEKAPVPSAPSEDDDPPPVREKPAPALTIDQQVDVAVASALNTMPQLQVRGSKPPAGASPWDAVFREWLGEQQDLASSWYRRIEIPSGTVFVFVLPRAADAEEAEEDADPTKTEKCPRGHAITEKSRQGSYCPDCAQEGHKYPGQNRAGTFRSVDYSVTKSRRRYGAPPVMFNEVDN